VRVYVHGNLQTFQVVIECNSLYGIHKDSCMKLIAGKMDKDIDVSNKN
jgi:hypothetical protein